MNDIPVRIKSSHIGIPTISLLLILSGCGKTTLSPKGYIAWIEDEANGLHQEKEIGDYRYSVQYKTLEYVAMKENLHGNNLTEQAVTEQVENLKGMEYITLSIRSLKDNKEMLESSLTNESEYFMRLEYFTSYIQNDVWIESSSKKYPCVFTHLERTYNMAPGNNILMAFEGLPDLTKPFVFVFNDNMLGGGKIKMTFQLPKKIPTIKF